MNYLGLEIGGTKLQIGGGGADGKLNWVIRQKIDPQKGAEGIRHQILQMFEDAKAKGQISDRPIRWGIGFGGPVNIQDGSIYKSHQIEGWSGFPIAQWLKTATQAEQVVVRNDADTAALAEFIAGAGVGCHPLAYITVGSGIGGGLILGGRIHKGMGRGAMEIGHLRVPDPDHPGCLIELELVASGWSIQRRAGMGSVPEVLQAAMAGDQKALRVIQTAAEAVGLGLSHVVHLLAPQRIILGGGVNLLPKSIWADPVKSAMENQLMTTFRGMTELVPAGLGEDVVVVGGICLAAGADSDAGVPN
ncbi:MAG: Glucokinase [Planctomycetota bacterium]|jgi:glucokinase